MKKICLGNEPIMFGDIKGCIYCEQQDEILKSQTSGRYNYIHSPLNKPALKAVNVIPTWYIPTGNKCGVLRPGQIRSTITVNKKKITLKDLTSVKPRKQLSYFKKRGLSFGDIATPPIDTLAVHGKNFDDGDLFHVNKSWQNVIQDRWGDVLDSGTLGREFGPYKTGEIYTNNYVNNIRMAYPGGDLDTAINNNRNCGIVSNTNVSTAGFPVTKEQGLIFNSKNPQIVTATSFGKRKARSRFGNLYSQMGPAYGPQYLMGKNYFDNAFAGGGFGAQGKPSQGSNQELFVNKFPPYDRLNSKFGEKSKKKPVVKVLKQKIKTEKPKKSKKIKVGEGTVLKIKNGKVKVKKAGKESVKKAVKESVKKSVKKVGKVSFGETESQEVAKIEKMIPAKKKSKVKRLLYNALKKSGLKLGDYVDYGLKALLTMTINYLGPIVLAALLTRYRSKTYKTLVSKKDRHTIAKTGKKLKLR